MPLRPKKYIRLNLRETTLRCLSSDSSSNCQLKILNFLASFLKGESLRQIMFSQKIDKISALVKRLSEIENMIWPNLKSTHFSQSVIKKTLRPLSEKIRLDLTQFGGDTYSESKWEPDALGTYFLWFIFHVLAENIVKTSQELRMLSTVTLNCQITKIVMVSGSQLSEL